LGDLSKRAQLFDGLRKFARACLHLVEQPHVLDCDHRLVGEGLDQFDLLVGEWFDMSLQDREDPAKSPLAQHRNCENGTVTLLLDQFRKFVCRLLQHVLNMDRALLISSPSRHRTRSWAQRMSHQVIGKSRPSAVGCRES
jgi:hypothetical protein